MNESVGFIGMGIMGRAMARNLVQAGFDLRVWNRTASRMDELIAAGAIATDSPAELSSQCDIIVVCVSDTPDVEAVVLGDNGIIYGAQRGSLVIDTSTISPHATQKIAEQLAQREIHMLDAPVSGGSEGAAKGTLTIMVGGQSSQLDRAMPVFQAMGEKITHVGGTGAGQLVKLVNQILVVGNLLAMSEALIFAQACGLDLEKTIEAVSGGAAGSWMLSMRAPQILERDWSPGFTIDMQQKDMRLALAAADELGVPVQIASMAFHYYRVLQAQGIGGEGNHALIKAMERLAGIEVRASQ